MSVDDPPRAYRPPPQRDYVVSPPARLTLLESLRRSVVIVLLPVLLLGGGAVGVGLARAPKYTSEARLNVGGLDLTQVSIQGYTTAVQELAISYARAIDATSVIAPVARQVGLSPLAVAQRVSATPIPGSSVIAVDASDKNAALAVRLANLMSDSLVRYAVQLNSGNTSSQHLLSRYLAASRALQLANAALQAVPPRTAKQRAAQTRSDLARLQLQTAAALYSQSQAGQATENLVQKLAPAAPPTSDRSSVLQQLVAGGLLAGLLIGVGLALARGNRLALRRLQGH